MSRRVPVVKRVIQFDGFGIPATQPKRCEARLGPQASNHRNPARYAKDEKLDPAKCNHLAKYAIDGEYYCRKHGSLYVLDELDPVLE